MQIDINVWRKEVTKGLPYGYCYLAHLKSKKKKKGKNEYETNKTHQPPSICENTSTIYKQPSDKQGHQVLC